MPLGTCPLCMKLLLLASVLLYAPKLASLLNTPPCKAGCWEELRNDSGATLQANLALEDVSGGMNRL